MNRSFLTRFAWLSIAAAILTIGLKAIAYELTGSVGLLSDALESFVNLAGALMALAMLTIAGRPMKVIYMDTAKPNTFRAGPQGYSFSWLPKHWLSGCSETFETPKPLEQIGFGIGVSIVASFVASNGKPARYVSRSAGVINRGILTE